MRNTNVLDIDGKEIFEGDIVAIYTAAIWKLEGNKELMEKAAGRYRVVYKHQDFRLEEISPHWFHPPYNSSVHEFTVLKVIE